MPVACPEPCTDGTTFPTYVEWGHLLQSFEAFCRLGALAGTVDGDAINVIITGNEPATGTFTLTRGTIAGDDSDPQTIPAGWSAVAFTTPITNTDPFVVAGADFGPGASEGYAGPDGRTGTAITINPSGTAADVLSYGVITVNP